MRFTGFLPPLLAVLALSACANSDDPSQGGFVTGIGNLATGSYERRLQDKKDELSSEQHEQQRLLQEKRILETEREETNEARAAAEAEARELDTELANLREELRTARANKRADEAELALLESELNTIATQRDLIAQDPTLSSEERSGHIDRLNERRKILEQTLADALSAN